MKLSKADFAKIRPIEWIVKDVGGKLMNTPINQTFNQLFWLDFLRYVFAPRFKQQSGVNSVSSFDITMPVLITETMDLQLPTILETAIYYYENGERPPIEFKININQTLTMVIAILVLLCVLIFGCFVKPSNSPIYRMI